MRFVALSTFRFTDWLMDELERRAWLPIEFLGRVFHIMALAAQYFVVLGNKEVLVVASVGGVTTDAITIRVGLMDGEFLLRSAMAMGTELFLGTCELKFVLLSSLRGDMAGVTCADGHRAMKPWLFLLFPMASGAKTTLVKIPQDQIRKFLFSTLRRARRGFRFRLFLRSCE